MANFSIKPGEIILWHNQNFKITRVVSLEYILAVNLTNGELEKLKIAEIKCCSEEKTVTERFLDLNEVSNEEWEVATKRLEIIQPLLDLAGDRTRNDVSNVSEKSGYSIPTLYRWIDRYEFSGKLSSLLRRSRSDKGGARIDVEDDLFVRTQIQDQFLHQQRPSVAKAYRDYKEKCQAEGKSLCSQSTYERRVQEIAPRERVLKRYGPKAAREGFDPAVDKFPSGKYPLEAVQVDHTQPNVILVDDEERRPIRRPWVTFAIDIFSRMIIGFFLSLESPSASSVGLCLTHAICRKETWLRSRGIDTSWPNWGLMRSVFADNGPDFKSKSVNRACFEYKVNLNWRPLQKPEYGGHVERLMRTVKTDLADLSGTTFRNPEDRGEYDSEGRAIFTFREFERWLTIYITKYYHQRSHTGIGTSPIKRFEEGLFYGDDMPMHGLPEVVADERRLYLDFLPFKPRTVQKYGIELDRITYFHPAITQWIGVKPDNQFKKFIVKYELDQISHVYFFDPKLKDYLEIPRVRREAPPMTRFEMNFLASELRKKGKNDIDEQALIDAQRELKQIEIEAKKSTVKTRRLKQRKKEAERNQAHIAEQFSAPPVKDESGESDWEPVDAFDEIDLGLD